jgi:hypothetical protein
VPEVRSPDPQAPSWFHEGGAVRLSGAVDQISLLERNNEDRPIGLQSVASSLCVGTCGLWRDHMLILTRERIERALTSQYSTGEKGLLELRLWDYYQIPNGPRTSFGDLQGDYVLIFKIERS